MNNFINIEIARTNALNILNEKYVNGLIDFINEKIYKASMNGKLSIDFSIYASISIMENMLDEHLSKEELLEIFNMIIEKLIESKYFIKPETFMLNSLGFKTEEDINRTFISWSTYNFL